jgi:hypothetical protein
MPRLDTPGRASSGGASSRKKKGEEATEEEEEEEQDKSTDVSTKVPEKKQKKKKEKKSKGMSLITMGTNGVSTLILVWGAFVASKFRGILYPTFPDIDSRTNSYLAKYGNAIEAGDTLHAKLWVSEEAWPQTKPLAEFDFVYDWDSFKPFSITVNATATKKKLLSERTVLLSAAVYHEKTGQVSRAKGSLIKKMKKPDVRPKYTLLNNALCPETEEPFVGKKKTHIGRGIPQMQVRLVLDHTLYPPPWAHGPYVPKLFVDEFWMTDDQLVTLNTTGTNNFSSEVHFDLMSAPRWRFQRHMEMSFEQNAKLFGEGSEEMLQMRDLVANTNPKLLTATFVVSILHLLFEFLAFKNDVIFWQSCSADTLNKYMSVQSILVGIIMQLLLLMYLWDESANVLVLLTSLASILIDAWKVQKAMKLSWFKLFGVLPLPMFVSKVTRHKADDFDGQAMRWLALCLSPGIIAYGIYTTVYDCHRGWYSLFLSFAASCVYSLGFVLMTPQVFINYKYKTIAFLPWRKFIYRAINTFIDDLFAFIIRMPTMHRLSCFRDDIVFIIYLIQRWQYPVDTSRTFDEDGYELEPEDDDNGSGDTESKKQQ